MKSNNLPARRELIEEVFQLRLLGALPLDLEKHAREQNWNLSEQDLQVCVAEADRMLAAAAEQMHAAKDEHKKRLLAHHFAARRALFARAMSVSDYKCALSCLQDEARLLDLYPAKVGSPTDNGPLVLNIVEVIVTERPAHDREAG